MDDTRSYFSFFLFLRVYLGLHEFVSHFGLGAEDNFFLIEDFEVREQHF